MCNLHEIFSILYSHDIIENSIKYCNQYLDNLNDLHTIIFYGFFHDNIKYLNKDDEPSSSRKYYEEDSDGMYEDDDTPYDEYMGLLSDNDSNDLSS